MASESPCVSLHSGRTISSEFSSSEDTDDDGGAETGAELDTEDEHEHELGHDEDEELAVVEMRSSEAFIRG